MITVNDMRSKPKKIDLIYGTDVPLGTHFTGTIGEYGKNKLFVKTYDRIVMLGSETGLSWSLPVPISDYLPVDVEINIVGTV